ncbi:hypothetical protein ILUMI_19368 [Ignelater luminosus]|uniref:Endonuclease/exonuclease/phosphatase domain-containing protein n=1 Tax=Ignelater luminosus TaxID=2038154 RepID=A0A8K0CJG2_IGNLU|nr:hypothetical protein ILUMI_19368 [Ignelater luminosus]
MWCAKVERDDAKSLPQSAITVSVRGIPIMAKTMQNARPAVVIDDGPDETKEESYNTLNEMIEKTKRQQLIIARDMNGRIEKRNNDEVVGKHREDMVNDNGQRLINISKQHALRINNTFYSHKNIHWDTWERPSLNQKSVIDYIITKQNGNLKILDARIKRGLNYESDHYLLIAKIVCINKTQVKNSKGYSANKNAVKFEQVRYNLHLLQEGSIRNLYMSRLKEVLNKTNREEDIEKEHDNIMKCFHQAAYEALGEITDSNRRSQLWWNEEI